MQLSGELAKVSFANLLQLVRSGGLAGKITISQGARLGAILIDGGLPVHAEVEGLVGKEAIFEFFLWKSGTFSFTEGIAAAGGRTIFLNTAGDTYDTFDRLLKDGLAYLEAKQHLDELGVGPDSVLKVVEDRDRGDYARKLMTNPGLERIDGVRSVSESLSHLSLSGRELTLIIADWFAGGLVQLARVPGNENSVELPDWVVARLKQDNQDLAKAIVDMVIWVDRVKCWMYQTDADFMRIINSLKTDQAATIRTSESQASESLANRGNGPMANGVSLGSGGASNAGANTSSSTTSNTGSASSVSAYGGAAGDVTAPAKPPI
ncbi:MAG: DUF4388 domain-containing protein [Candidatus Obscuribacterales bacterium]|nr:DUF4388 domain-containing protein [Candidatus Obscuribacterales bacterium]